MNEIKYTKKSLKQLSHIEKLWRGRIFEACKVLGNFPNCANVKVLVNYPYQYRLRVGDFRVFFDFDGVVHIIFIEEVKKRDEHTY